MLYSLTFVFFFTWLQMQVQSSEITQQPPLQENYDFSEIEPTEQSESSYMLPASSNIVLSEKRVNDELVCPGAGLFADVNNNCQIFHMCHLTPRRNGQMDLMQYSFFCGQGTIFDQYSLTCQVPEKAIPCEYAPEFYNINKRTEEGKREVFLHREEDKSILRPFLEEASSRENILS